MLNNISIATRNLFHDKISNPFWGTFFISWVIWNWKIPYLTFFVSQETIKPQTKIEYICENYMGIEHILLYPFISSIILLTIFPFVTNGAYWLYLKFRKWRTDQLNLVDKKQLLTFEESIAFRNEMIEQESRFVTLLDSKKLEIRQLAEIIEQKDSRLKQFEKEINDLRRGITQEKEKSGEPDPKEVRRLFETIKNNEKYNEAFKIIIPFIQNELDLTLVGQISDMTRAFFETHEIIRQKSQGIFKFTELGMAILKLYSSSTE